jgi:UDP-N-acetylmuramoyl-L-alanyl-D-glutamate--2,6-diaminopimelate ligase
MSRELVKKVIPKSVFRRIEPYGHWGEAILANARHRFPARGLKVIGVTGTDGKSTTSTLIYTMLKEAGFKVGLLTTINIDLGNGLQPNSTRLTTMKSGEVFKALGKMKKNKIQWVVLEVTSHALAQRRVWGVPFTLAVMTHDQYHSRALGLPWQL